MKYRTRTKIGDTSSANNKLSSLKIVFVSSLSLAIIGCANNATNDNIETSSIDSSTAAVQQELKVRSANLDARENSLAQREAQLSSSLKSTSSLASNEKLLPPNAKVGECYARAWVKPIYETQSQQVKVRDGSQEIKLIDATYEWVEKDLLVKEESTQLKTIPAVYGTESETLLVKEERNSWRTNLDRNAAPASEKLLSSAKTHGINLDGASPGMCFHEHFVPAEYRTVTEDVLASEASTKIETIAAKYETVEEQVLVSEASYRIEEVPAVFESETETVLDKPAHTIWKKGTGPIQRIDEATGEIMCLVEVPATYKTISKRKLVSAATTRRVEIPAVYKTVKVRKLVAKADQRTIEIPATYKPIRKKELVSSESFVWHEVSDKSMTADSRTGAKICLVNEPAQYKKVSRKVVVKPASVQEINIPATYKTVKVKQLVSEAREERIEIPASYKTVTNQKLVADGHMEWRSILCETNMTSNKISAIQNALQKEGYDPGPIDGVIGAQTMQAVNAFQKAKSLPVDKYLNLDTLAALGVSPK